MPNYEKMYFILFNAITDALEQLETKRYAAAAIGLAAAQCQTEELYMLDEETVS